MWLNLLAMSALLGSFLVAVRAASHGIAFDRWGTSLVDGTLIGVTLIVVVRAATPTPASAAGGGRGLPSKPAPDRETGGGGPPDRTSLYRGSQGESNA